MLISTTFDLTGFDITANMGEVFGLTVRSRNIGAGFIGAFRSMFGGEVPQFTKLLVESRNQAMARMVGEAGLRGANAVVGMRFDGGAFGQWSEICAYGTAVYVVPRSDYARQQLEAAQQGLMAHQVDYQRYVPDGT